MKYIRLYCLFVSILLIIGCNIKKMGSDFVKGANENIDSTGYKLMTGISDKLTDSITQIKVARFLDSLVTSLSASLNPKLTGIRDSIFNEKVMRWADSLVEILTGEKINLNIKAFQASLVGKTKTDVLEMRNSFESLLREILSDSTKTRIGSFRDELLGPRTSAALNNIIDSAMITLANRYKSDLNPVVKKDVSFISKNATALLLLLGGIAAFLILLVWWSRRRYISMLRLLTKHIHKIPDQKIYDLVTSKIKDEAINIGVEKHLREFLNENGMLGTEAWISYQNKLNNMT